MILNIYLALSTGQMLNKNRFKNATDFTKNLPLGQLFRLMDIRQFFREEITINIYQNYEFL